jgi:hypothetical protein
MGFRELSYTPYMEAHKDSCPKTVEKVLKMIE